MQSVLISSKDRTKSREEAEKILRELKIHKFDVSYFEFEKAVGIPDIREIQKKVYFRPFKSEAKAIIIDITPGITTEAQNALLKTLEESPEDTIIILISQSVNELLPTIISRCKVVEVSSEAEQNPSISQYLSILVSNHIGDKLKLAQDLSKDKEQTLNFLENSILNLRKDLISNYNKIKQLQKFHTIIKTTNVNLRLALENLFLNI